jgi:hypothetical protein
MQVLIERTWVNVAGEYFVLPEFILYLICCKFEMNEDEEFLCTWYFNPNDDYRNFVTFFHTRLLLTLRNNHILFFWQRCSMSQTEWWMCCWNLWYATLVRRSTYKHHSHYKPSMTLNPLWHANGNRILIIKTIIELTFAQELIWVYLDASREMFIFFWSIFFLSYSVVILSYMIITLVLRWRIIFIVTT